MSDFYVNIPGLRKAAGEIGDAAKELESAIAELSKGGATSFLSGAGAADIDKQLGLLSEELLGCNDSIKTMSSELYQITDMYENTEKEVVASAEKCTADPGVVAEQFVFEATPVAFYSEGPNKTNSALKQTAFFPTTEQWKEILKHPAVIDNVVQAKRKQLKEGLPQFLIRGVDGTVKSDWYEIESVLKKDADQITDDEYKNLAMVFAYMDDEDTATFLKCMLTKNNDISHHDSMTTFHRPNEYSEWSIDRKKCRVLQKIIIDHSDMYDSNSIDWEDVVNNWDEKESPLDEYALLDYAGELDKKHDGLLAKASLLGACEMIGTETSRKHNLGRVSCCRMRIAGLQQIKMQKNRTFRLLRAKMDP